MSCHSPLDMKLRAMEHNCVPMCVVSDEYGTELHFGPHAYPITVTLFDRLRFLGHMLTEVSL